MTIATTNLSSTDVKLAKVAHGLMMMTWKQPIEPDEQCFEAIKAGLDLVGPGEKVLLNSSEFYGVEPREANLHLLNRFFTKYPDYADKAFVSVKGGTEKTSMAPNGSYENTKRSIVDSQKALGSIKKIDLFEHARKDPKIEIEEIVKNVAKCVEEGLVSHIGLSEVSAATLRRASKVAQISIVEIEVSPFSYEDETRKVIAAAKELGVSVLAYSPLGRGFLTGVTRKDLDPSDVRYNNPRFSEEAQAVNQKLVDQIAEVAKAKGVTTAQICIAWVASLGSHVIPLPGSSKATRTLENLQAANISLTPEEKKKLDDAIESFEVAGSRYDEHLSALNWA